jgi:hypothetical protein
MACIHVFIEGSIHSGVCCSAHTVLKVLFTWVLTWVLTVELTYAAAEYVRVSCRALRAALRGQGGVLRGAHMRTHGRTHMWCAGVRARLLPFIAGSSAWVGRGTRRV